MRFTQEHRSLYDTTSNFIKNEINPHVDEWEKAGIFPAHELFKKMGDLGLLGIDKPEQFGGLGLDWSYTLMFSEALGEIACGGIPMAVGVQACMATPALARFGSDELRQEFLMPTIAGDYVACLGVSEVGAGSDVASIKTTARSDGDDYIISGSKMWITNGTQADFMCMLANTSADPAHRNKSLIIVPLKSKGVTISKKLEKLGMRSSDTAQIHFDDVRVPKKNRIGEEGQGFFYQMRQFQEERMFAAAKQVMAMENAVRDVINYTSQRTAFGKSLIENQSIQFRLAELETEIESLRALLYRSVENYVAGEDVTPLASMAKLKAGRLAREVADSCLQYYGGMGFMNETPISRMFRDTRLASIGGGADEIMLTIVAKNMIKRR
ncbi:acyl-CoA dehydrogenase [Allopusillimonas ginsengisoli]|nr:acyl-CoA dehydrogenase [Allopusillimonas ginsengisoli]